MDITSKPNLKPFRQYSEHEVINLYAHVAGDVNKGTFVKLSAADGNTNVADGAGNAHVGYDSAWAGFNAPSRATVLRPVVNWKVATATSGSQVIGMTLYDVKETNKFGEKYIFRPSYETSEQEVVRSGEAVPILVRGIVKTNGFNGTPGPGSGAAVHNSSGVLDVKDVTYTSADKVGKFLTSADAHGYALFKIEL